MRMVFALFVVALAGLGCAERSSDTSSPSPPPVTYATVAPKPSIMKRVNVPHVTPLAHATPGAVVVDAGRPETTP